MVEPSPTGSVYGVPPVAMARANVADGEIDEVAREYGATVQDGGAILAIALPSGTVDEETANAILGKYAATNVNRYASRGSVASSHSGDR